MRDFANTDWAYSALICPVCRAPLARVGGSVVCPARHSFDLSAKGTLNLAQATRGQHGDDPGMVAARRRFLAAGYYAPLCDAIADAAKELFSGGIILDAGCGEGYYTAAVARRLFGARLIALDLSPDAVRAVAAREEARAGQLFPLVAGVYRLPLADSSVSLVLSVFSPFAREEFLRVLTPDGCLLSVIPGRRHLYELKEVLYDEPYENEENDDAIEGFSFLGAKDVNAEIALKTPSEILDLFHMTPYSYRTPPAGKERLAALFTLTVGISFRLLLYRKA